MTITTRPARSTIGCALACLVILPVAVTPGNGTTDPGGPIGAGDRVVTLECDDEQHLTEHGGPDEPFPPSFTIQDWLRVRFLLKESATGSPATAASFEVVLREFQHERTDSESRSQVRWPTEGTAEIAVAAADWDGNDRRWHVRFRPSSTIRIPDHFTEEFLMRVLGALVVSEPRWQAGSAIVTREGRWRRVGGTEYRASVRQVWTRQVRMANGLIPLGWRGEMTILDPAASPGTADAGRGTAAESGAFDPVEGMYQDLTQSWDVEFETEGARIAWRHRCSTRVVQESISHPTDGP